MAIREVDAEAIGNAIIATEKEIAGDPWGIEEATLDETGDRTVEMMGEGLEGQHEPDDDDDEGDEDDESSEASESEEGEGEAGEAADKSADGEAKPEPKEGDGKEKPLAEVAPDSRDRVPARRLREQTDRTKAVEAERDALRQQLEAERSDSRKQFDTLNSRFDAVLTQLKPPAQQQNGEAKPSAVPDFFEDPNAFIAHQTKPLLDTVSQLRNDLAAQRVETSMAMAHSKHGDKFAKAYEAVTKLDPRNPDDRATVQRIYSSASPGEALVSWHGRNETLRQVGDDPDAYAARLRKEEREALMKDPEFRKQLVESLQAEASTGDNGRARTTVRLPKSLNGAAGGNAGRNVAQFEHDDSDKSVADSAWRT